MPAATADPLTLPRISPAGERLSSPQWRSSVTDSGPDALAGTQPNP